MRLVVSTVFSISPSSFWPFYATSCSFPLFPSGTTTITLASGMRPYWDQHLHAMVKKLAARSQ
jgi:hypothetical protein